MINLHESMGPGSNSRPMDLQSDLLPPVLQGLVILVQGIIFYIFCPGVYFDK